MRDSFRDDVIAVKSKLLMSALVAFTLVLLGASSVFAITAYLSVSPKRIPENGIVTIYIENKYETDPITVDYIEVEHESGAKYTKSLGVVLNPGDSTTEYFGTGIGGWTPAADTSQEGKYVVTAQGPWSPVEKYFDVSTMFSVPEFVLPTALVTAVGLALLLGVSSKMNKKRT